MLSRWRLHCAQARVTDGLSGAGKNLHAGAPEARLRVQLCVGLYEACHVSYVHTHTPAPTTEGLYA